MKALLPLFAAVAVTVSAQEPFTYETSDHLFSTLDANGDSRRDTVVIDRKAGTFTVGFQDASGGFAWSAPEPTGTDNPTGLAAGNLTTAGSDAFAVTSRNANRVSVFTMASATSSPVVRQIFPSTPTAKWLAAVNIDSDAPAELIVSAESGAQFRVECMDALDSTPVSLWTRNFSIDTRRINPLRPRTGVTTRMADLYGSGFYMDELLTTGVGTSTAAGGSAVTADTLYATGTFGGSAFTSVVLYEPGSSTARYSQLSLPSTAYVWSAVSSLTFPAPVRLIVTVPITGGSRLAVLFMDGTARIYDYSGTGSVSLRSTLPGQHELITPVASDAVLTMRGNAWQRFNTAGTGTLTASTGGSFPQPSAAARVSNVVYLSGEPFANVAAIFNGSQHTRDWTVSASGGPLNWTIFGLNQDVSGLGILGNSATLTAPVSSSHVLTNQYRTNISVRSLDGSTGAFTGDVDIQPPSGTYPPLASGDRFVITLTSSSVADVIYYRLNGAGAWTVYNSAQPPSLTVAGSIEAWAGTTQRRTPVRSAAWSFAANPALATGGLTDADGDGLSDQWEKAFGITSPTADADGDGISNLAEFQNGSDPSLPNGSGPLVLSAGYAPGGGALRLEWSAADTTVSLQTSTDMASWATVRSGIVNAGGTNRFDVPLNPPASPARYYRLKRP